MNFDIIVLGSLHMDIMVSAPDRPRRGETVTGDAWSLKPGGKGGNQAVEAARAGARTAMIGAVGDDEFGRTLVQNLQDHGVDAAFVGVRPRVGSGMSVAIMDSGGDYGAVIVSGANLLLAATDIEAAHDLLPGARWILLQQEVPDAANLAAACAAHGLGIKTILNAAPVRPLADEVKGLIDILVVNELEAEGMGAAAVDSLGAAVLAATSLLRFAEATVVTVGGTGVAVATRSGRRVEIAGHAVPVVSTHGAGDCFIGSLAAQLARGADLEEAARYANARAALQVAAGAVPARIRGQSTLGDLLLELGEGGHGLR